MPGKRRNNTNNGSSRTSHFRPNGMPGENPSAHFAILSSQPWMMGQSAQMPIFLVPPGMTPFPSFNAGLAMPSFDSQQQHLDLNSISSVSISSSSSFGMDRSPPTPAQPFRPHFQQQPGAPLRFSSSSSSIPSAPPAPAQPFTIIPQSAVFPPDLPASAEVFSLQSIENGLLPISMGDVDEFEATGDGEDGFNPRLHRVRCALCNVGCRSQASLNDHFKGKSHMRRLRYLRKRSIMVRGVPLPIPEDELLTFFVGLEIDRSAELSFLATTTEEDAEGVFQYVAFATQTDAERAIRLAGRPLGGFPAQISSAYKPMECFVCEISFNSVAQTEQHLHSRKHQRRMEWYVNESTVTVKGLTPLIREIELQEFFKGYEIIPGGIIICLDPKTTSTNSTATLTETDDATAAICDSLEAVLRGIDGFEVECRVTFESPTEAQRAVREKNGRPLLGEDGYGGPVELVIIKMSKPVNGSDNDKD